MPGQRAKDKKRIEGWIPVALYDWAAAFAAALGKTNTDVLTESLTEYRDRHGTGTAVCPCPCRACGDAAPGQPVREDCTCQCCETACMGI